MVCHVYYCRGCIPLKKDARICTVLHYCNARHKKPWQVAAARRQESHKSHNNWARLSLSPSNDLTSDTRVNSRSSTNMSSNSVSSGDPYQDVHGM